MSDEYTKEQHVAVIRVMKLKITDYYGILMVERTCTTIEVKKAYRKLALQMHPDKNKAPNADEAFKRVSKAFQVLSDDTKRKIYDQTGADPDSRGGMPGPSNSPFGPRFRSQAGGPQFGRAPPDDIFNMFFGGAPGGMGGMGPGGAQYHFSFGGDPNDIFGSLFGDSLFGESLFGGQRRRAEQQRQQQRQNDSASNSGWFSILLIVAMLLAPSLLSMLGLTENSSLPKFRFDERKPYTEERFTPKYNVPFFVNPKDLKGLSDQKIKQLDKTVENKFISDTRSQCSQEYHTRLEKMQDSLGWFFRDEESYNAAKNMPLPHCELLEQLGIRLR